MKSVKELGIKSQADVKTLSSEKLLEELKTAQKSLYTLAMKLANGELKQTHQIKVLRRYVAMLHTTIRQAQ